MAKTKKQIEAEKKEMKTIRDILAGKVRLNLSKFTALKEFFDEFKDLASTYYDHSPRMRGDHPETGMFFETLKVVRRELDYLESFSSTDEEEETNETN